MATTSFDRVFASLEHKEPDRVPIDLGGTAVTGININALRRLKAYLGIPGEALLRDDITQLAVHRRRDVCRAWTSMCVASDPTRRRTRGRPDTTAWRDSTTV